MVLDLQPRWTESSFRKMKGEDHLGIKNVAIVMADRLQSGITSITPRARYWSFFAWVLHDFIQHGKDLSLKSFQHFLKRQEWFFVLANMAEAKERGASTNQVMGVAVAEELWNQTELDFLPFQVDYLQDSYGGYSVYRNVMKTLGIMREGDLEKGIQLDRVTNGAGKQLAEAFQRSIESTEYYQSWRHQEGPIPRQVLIEYGRKASLSRLYEGEDKAVLRSLFLPKEAKDETERLRCQSLGYYQFLVQEAKGKAFTRKGWRRMMYDVCSPRGEEKQRIPEIYQTVAKGWEIYQGRQLFTYSLETIWSYLLRQLSIKTRSIGELLGKVETELHGHGFSTHIKVSQLLDELPLSRQQRDDMMDAMGTGEHAPSSVWNPLLVMLDVYSRFCGRDDLEPIHMGFLKLGGEDHLSLHKWETDVTTFLHRPVGDLLEWIIRFYILEQHQQVALAKIFSTGNETYHFAENEGRLHFIAMDRPAYNVFRVDQAMSILEDLGYVRRDGNVWMKR